MSESSRAPRRGVAPSAVAAATAAAVVAAACGGTAEPEIVVEPGWELVWNDEFSGGEIDRSKWTYDIGGWGWGNGEAQYYTDRDVNSRIEDGHLVIEAHQEKFSDGESTSYYTSARMLTQGLAEFQYGRIEARIKVPAGAGLWPAFWMLGADFDKDSPDESRHWPHVGEIDIMEYIGRKPNTIMGTVHGPGYSGALGLTKWRQTETPVADEFHVYAIEWDETGIRWFFDGEQYHEITHKIVGKREWVFDRPFFLILNLAVGGQLPGPIGLDVEFPVRSTIDYVRVFQPVADANADTDTDQETDH